MKYRILIPLLFAITSTCFLVAENEKTWKEKAAERFGDSPSPEQKSEIEASIPEPTATTTEARKILVFYRCEGFIHTSIPFGNYAMQAIANGTGAFEVDLADEYAVFTSDNLARYDAIVFNNTTTLDPNEDQRAAILEFVNGGKGIVGFHAAADNFNKWDEGIALIGGIFDGHPWTAGGDWAFQVEDPDHTLNEAFGGEGFIHKDEIYWYKPENFEGREKLRVLLSLDMSHPPTANAAKTDKWKEKLAGRKVKDVDVPVSWLKKVGEGRLFFTNFGHNDMTFANTEILQHMLDGIQYAMGDLEADATPSAEVDVKVVRAPKEKAEKE